MPVELPSHVDPAYISRVIRALCAEGDVIEARVLGVPRAGHISGYLDDFDRMASRVARYDNVLSFTYSKAEQDTLRPSETASQPVSSCYNMNR